MISSIQRFGLPGVVGLLLAFVPCVARAGQGPTPQASQVARAAVADIQLSYKRDPRVVDPFRGVGVWADGPRFGGAYGQDSVETVAKAVSAKGQLLKPNIEWVASDPDMVTVSPTQGEYVAIKVHRAGESKLKVTAAGFSKELVVHAESTGKFIRFSIAPPAPPKPTGPTAEVNPALKTPKQQMSYAAGMRLAKTLRAQSVEVDADLVEQGIKDVLEGRETMMNEEQEGIALMGLETGLNVTAARLAARRLAEKNKKEGEDFLAVNKQKEGVVTLPSGLQYKIIKQGNGRKVASALDVAAVQYRSSFVDGTVFDDSHNRKDGGPVTFQLRGVIKGWQEALKLMPAGSEWEIIIPPELAYGEHGVPRANIPPNATLIFDVELLSVKGQGAETPSSNSKTQKTEVSPEISEAGEKIIAGETKTEKKPETNQ